MKILTFGMQSTKSASSSTTKPQLLRVNTSGLTSTTTTKAESEEYKGGVDYFLSELDKKEKEKAAKSK